MKAVGFTRYPGSFPGNTFPPIKHQEGIRCPLLTQDCSFYLALESHYVGKESIMGTRVHTYAQHPCWIINSIFFFKLQISSFEGLLDAHIRVTRDHNRVALSWASFLGVTAWLQESGTNRYSGHSLAERKLLWEPRPSIVWSPELLPVQWPVLILSGKNNLFLFLCLNSKELLSHSKGVKSSLCGLLCSLATVWLPWTPVILILPSPFSDLSFLFVSLSAVK